MNNKIEVELINAKLLDFKTDNGDIIQGIKLFYRENVVKENSITADVESAFLTSEKCPRYKEVFEELKEAYKNNELVSEKTNIILEYKITSINSKPTILGISIVE